MSTDLIERKFNALPEDLRREALDFIDFLITKRGYEAVSSQFDFAWEGELSDLRDKHSSVDLQHKSLEWR